ncbi:MAG: M28 family peptidase [Gemmatimonadaceae bacterium]
MAALPLACRTAPSPIASGEDTADTVAIRSDIVFLASDALEGRATGTAGNDSAAAYIARRFHQLGLQPLADGGFLQHFTATSVAAAHSGMGSALPAQNVVARLRGSDRNVAGEFVVVGAHFDHLGRSGFGALDPTAKNEIRNGADDNASGTAAVLELARLLSRDPPRRSVVFVTFSGEELGLLGSQYFVRNPPVALNQVAAMINFDMVGRLRDDKVIVYGVETATELPGIVDSSNIEPRLAIRAVGDGFGPSDHSSFYAQGIPVLHLFTDLHEDYHRAGDDANKVNVAGEARVIKFAERIVRAIANRPSRLTFVRSTAPAPVAPGSTSGYGAYLGTIPDMGAADVVGVRITGVRADSPADQAGLKAGDVIVEFAGTPIKDLYRYTDALRAHKPGEVVSIVVMRGAQRVELSATLGARGR